MSEREFVHMSTMCAVTRADIISPGAAGGYELPGMVLELSWDSLQVALGHAPRSLGHISLKVTNKYTVS